MSDAFDPYHKWLGIPPAEQPPNHYRLLGIASLESDADVIDAAAEQRMTFLQNIAQGPQVEHSQRLLNEVAAARLCLLNQERKTEYDAGLQAEQSQTAIVVDEPSAGDFDFLNPTVQTPAPKNSPAAPTIDFPDFSGVDDAGDAAPDFSGIADSTTDTGAPDFSGLSHPAPPPTTPPVPIAKPVQPPSTPTTPPPADDVDEVPDFSGINVSEEESEQQFPVSTDDRSFGSPIDEGPSPGGFNISTDPPPTVVVPPQKTQPDPGDSPEAGGFLDRIKQLPSWALMVSGSSIAAILALVFVLIFRGPNITKELSDANQAMLIVVWPLEERGEGAYLAIDDNEKTLADKAELEFRVPAGKEHHIRIERDGYRTISQHVMFEKGQRKKLTLKWEREGG